MKTRIIFPIVFAATSLWGAEAPAPTYTSVAVYRTSGVAASDVDRVTEHVHSSTRIPCRNAGEVDAKSATCADLAGELKGLPKEDDLCAVVLFAAPASETAHTIFDVTNRVVVVNTTAVKDPQPEKYLRRLDRLALRGVYSMLGLPSCPHPLCCLFPYGEQHTIDMIGRNGCPPCQFKAQTAAQEKRVKRDTPSFPSGPGIPAPGTMPVPGTAPTAPKP